MIVFCYVVEVKKTFVRWTETNEDLINSEMARERSVKGTKIIRSCFMWALRINTESVEDANEVAREDDADCSEELLRKNSLSI